MRMRINPMVKDFISPVYKTAGAAAFDIFLQHDLTLTPNNPVTIKLGFAAGMEDGYYAEIQEKICTRKWLFGYTFLRYVLENGILGTYCQNAINKWWPFTDLNSGQNDYESSALTD